MDEELVIEDGAQLHPLLVVVEQSYAACDADEVFEDRDLSAEFTDRLGSSGEVDDLIDTRLELGTLFFGNFFIEIIELVGVEAWRRSGGVFEVERHAARRPLVDRRRHGSAVAGLVGRTLPFPQTRLESNLASLERSEDGFRTRGEASLQHGERKSHVVSALLVACLSEAFRATHLGADVPGDQLVQFTLRAAEFVLDRVSATLGKQRLALEGEELLLHHAPHQAPGVSAVHTGAELALEPVAVQQRHEQLEVLLLARVRGRGHKEEVVRGLSEQPPEPEPLGLVDLTRPGRVVRRHAVRLVDHDRVPGDVGELLDQVIAAGELVHPRDKERVLCEHIATLRVVDHLTVEDLEREIELLRQLFPPLLHEAAGGDDQRSFAVGAEDELLEVEAGHDRLAGAWVVGEQEP